MRIRFANTNAPAPETPKKPEELEPPPTKKQPQGPKVRNNGRGGGDRVLL